MMRRNGLLALIIGWVLACVVISPASAQRRGEMVLVGEPTVDGAFISVPVRFNHVNPLSIVPLGAVNFSVDEPAAELSVTRESKLPHALVMVVSVGFGSDTNLIQATLRAYTDVYIKNGDAVALVIVDERGVTITESANVAQLADAISAIRSGASYPRIDSGVRAAVDWLNEQPDTHVKMGLLVASYLNANEDKTTSAAFAGVGVPLHVVQAHTYRQTSTTALREMSAATGGLFIDNLEGLFTTGIPARASASLKVLYDAMAATRDVFTVRYRATSTALVTEPSVTLKAQLTLTEALTTTFTYQRVFTPPTLTFSQQTIAPIRRPTIGPAGLVFDVESYAISTRVVFNDNVPRRILSLQLEVIDQNTGQMRQSSIEVNPQQESSGAYRVNWSLVDFIEPRGYYPVVLRITATDELGLTAVAEQQAAVTVADLPATATFTPSATFTPTRTPTHTLTPVVSATPTPPPSQGGGLSASLSAPTPFAPPSSGGVGGDGVPTPLVWILGGLAALFALISLLLLVALRRARRAKAGTEGDAAVVGLSLMDIPTPVPDDKQVADEFSFQRPTQIYGRLLVKSGLPAGEVLVSAEEFVIGRKLDSDVHYRIDKPFISPRHCLITHKRGRFTIKDLNSKNGVFVNGERIQADRDVIVPIGSEVAITQNVVFELWDPNTVVKVDYQGENIRSSRVTEDTAQNTGTQSRLTATTAGYDDSEPIDDDYSPV